MDGTDVDAASDAGRHLARPRANGGGQMLVRRAVARAKQGDSSALHFLYARYADEVQALVRGIVRDDVAAAEVTERVFLGVETAIGEHESGHPPFRGWLLSLARATAVASAQASLGSPVRRVG